VFAKQNRQYSAVDKIVPAPVVMLRIDKCKIRSDHGQLCSAAYSKVSTRPNSRDTSAIPTHLPLMNVRSTRDTTGFGRRT
jgi:hypothetical protein